MRNFPFPAVCQQAAQFLMADSFPEFILDLPAEGDAAAQVGPGLPQRADGELPACQVPQADGEVAFVPRFLLKGILLLEQRYGPAGLAAQAVAVGQFVQRMGLMGFILEVGKVFCTVGKECFK